MKTGGDAQEQIGNHCGEDLQLNGVVVVAKKLADIEMLLDPAEQQFDLPAHLVERRDLNRGPRKIVGDESDGSTGLALDANAPQRHRQPGVPLADEDDLVIADDLETIALALAHRAMAGGAKPHVRLCPGDEEGLGIIDLLPPVEAAITLVEHI